MAEKLGLELDLGISDAEAKLAAFVEKIRKQFENKLSGVAAKAMSKGSGTEKLSAEERAVRKLDRQRSQALIAEEKAKEASVEGLQRQRSQAIIAEEKQKDASEQRLEKQRSQALITEEKAKDAAQKRLENRRSQALIAEEKQMDASSQRLEKQRSQALIADEKAKDAAQKRLEKQRSQALIAEEREKDAAQQKLEKQRDASVAKQIKDEEALGERKKKIIDDYLAYTDRKEKEGFGTYSAQYRASGVQIIEDAFKNSQDPEQTAKGYEEWLKKENSRVSETIKNNDAIEAANKQLTDALIANKKLETSEMLELVGKYQREIEHVEKTAESRSPRANKKALEDIKDRFNKEVKAETDAINDKQRLAKKQAEFERQIGNRAATNYATNAKNKLSAEEASSKAREELAKRLAEEQTKYAGYSTDVIIEKMQEVTDKMRQQMAEAEREASKGSGAGFGSFTNNVYQAGQALEDFSVGFQLNGLQGGIRGAANNVAFLADQLDPQFGLPVQLGLAAVQVAMFAMSFSEAEEASDSFLEKILELKKGFSGLTAEAVAARKEAIDSFTSAGERGFQDFGTAAERAFAAQRDVFKVEDKQQFVDELNKSTKAMQEFLDTSLQLKVLKDIEDRIRRADSTDSGYTRTKEDLKELESTQKRIQEATEALSRSQEHYNQVAAEFGLPAIGTELERYLELKRKYDNNGTLYGKEKDTFYETADAIVEMYSTLEDAEKELKKVQKEQYTNELLRFTAARTEEERKALDVIEQQVKEAEQQIALMSIKKKLQQEEIRINREIARIADKLFSETDQKKRNELVAEYDKLVKELEGDYQAAATAAEALKVDDSARLAIIKEAQQLTEKMLGDTKEQLKTAEQAVSAEEKKLELYQKQLQTLAEQQYSAQQKGAFGSIQATENIQSKKIQEQIKLVQDQANAYKQYVQQQVAYQNQLAQMFGGQSVDASGFLGMVDAQAQAQIEQLQNKQISLQRQANREREKLFQAEAQRQKQLAATAQSPEDKIKAIEAEIKAQEDLRQLQLSQTSEGGAFGVKKKAEYEATGKVIDKLYQQQIALTQQAADVAEAERQKQQQLVNELGMKLEVLNQLKEDLANKDIVSEMDVKRAEAIREALTQAALAGGVTGLLGLFQGGFASGGKFDGSGPMLVGEKGPEIILPSAAGTVLTNEQSKSLMASVFASQMRGGGGGNTNVTTAINTVNIQTAPVVSASNLATQLRNNQYSARARRR